MPAKTTIHPKKTMGTLVASCIKISADDEFLKKWHRRDIASCIDSLPDDTSAILMKLGYIAMKYGLPSAMAGEFTNSSKLSFRAVAFNEAPNEIAKEMLANIRNFLIELRPEINTDDKNSLVSLWNTCKVKTSGRTNDENLAAQTLVSLSVSPTIFKKSRRSAPPSRCESVLKFSSNDNTKPASQQPQNVHQQPKDCKSDTLSP